MPASSDPRRDVVHVTEPPLGERHSSAANSLASGSSAASSEEGQVLQLGVTWIPQRVDDAGVCYRPSSLRARSRARRSARTDTKAWTRAPSKLATSCWAREAIT